MNPHFYILKQEAAIIIPKIKMAFISLLLLLAGNALKAQATLTTDQPDYSPGSTVTLTGSGFQPGETVQLQVLHDNADGDNGTSGSHEPWTTNADANGSFVTNWLVPNDEDELNSSLVATADGQSSLLHAETSFTDANWTIGPSYTDICGGVEGEFIFTITQTNNTGFLNSRFRIVFPASAGITSASVISVSASKNWTVSVAAGNDICLRAVNQTTDALSTGQSITFKVIATPGNILGQVTINGVSAAAGAGCPTTGTTATLPLKILRISKLSPVFTQCPAGISVNTDNGLCSAVVAYTPQIIGTDSVISYEFSGATTGSGSGTGSGSAFNKGITHVTITASNSCATVTCNFTVTVTDHEMPVIHNIGADNTISCPQIPVFSIPTVSDNCPGATLTFADVSTPGSCTGSYSVTRTWTATDASGNTSTAGQTINVQDITAPTVTFTPGDVSVNSDFNSCSASNVDIGTPTATDECSAVIITNDHSTTTFAPGVTVVTWSIKDECNNAVTFTQNVTVSTPAITGSLSSGSIACYGGTTLLTVTAGGGSGVYLYSLDGGAAQASNTFTVSAGNHSAVISDANGCTASITRTISVTQPALLTATCQSNTADNTLYFGYSGDQSETITVTPAGGTGPYTVTFTMSRALLCNQVTDAGDEIWSPVGGGSTTGNSCPVYPNTTSSIPVSTKSISSGGYAVTVTLMANADITATVTDANGCTYSCTTHIHAEDVRCFAGNSGNAKVTICHKTGSTHNPCIKICVDENAVAEHLAHGDFLGQCTPDCKPPVISSSISSGNSVIRAPENKTLNVKIANNPNHGSNDFVLTMGSNSTGQVHVTVTNIMGIRVFAVKGDVSKIYRFGSQFSNGMYIVEVVQGKEVRRLKVIKAN